MQSLSFQLPLLLFGDHKPFKCKKPCSAKIQVHVQANVHSLLLVLLHGLKEITISPIEVTKLSSSSIMDFILSKSSSESSNAKLITSVTLSIFLNSRLISRIRSLEINEILHSLFSGILSNPQQN